METSSMRLKMSFIVCLISLPIIIMVTLMYQNSSFGLFEGFSKGIIMKEMTQKNVTTGGPNVTHDNFGEKDKSGAKFKSK